MDLEGVGAITAAAVAALGIPATVLVGRWQTRAAVRTAEETGRAGVAQARATYEAALDAVRAQASEAHTQWRRDIQREAYVSLLLASQQLCGDSDRLIDASELGPAPELFASIEEAERALTRAHLVVSLESPGIIATLAGELCELTTRVAIALQSHAAIVELWSRLPNDTRHPDGEGMHSDEVHILSEELGMLRDAIQREGVSAPPDMTSAGSETDEPAGGVRALHRAVLLSFAQVPLFTRVERDLMLNSLYIGPITQRGGFNQAKLSLERTQDSFIAAAREQLDAPSTDGS